jgi:hypothetical protein
LKQRKYGAIYADPPGVRQRKSRAAFGARTRQDNSPEEERERDLEHEQHSARSGQPQYNSLAYVYDGRH